MANKLSRRLCFQQSRRNRREKRKNGCSKKTDRSEGGGRRKARETGGGKREESRRGKVRKRETAGRRSQMQLLRGEERIAEVRPRAGRKDGEGRRARQSGDPGEPASAERGCGHFSRWLGVGQKRKLQRKAARKTKW